MIKRFYILILCLLNIIAYTQEIKYSESVKNIYERSIHDFKETFYEETGAKVKIYYSCKDSLFSDDCSIKRKLFFNEKGRIVSDTSFIDTLYSAINRVFHRNKILIHKTHPEPTYYKYNYKTKTDSLILDSLQRPVMHYEQGTLVKTWMYDNMGRLINLEINPENIINNKKRTYIYSNDTIKILEINRSIIRIDTIKNYLIFDEKERLIFDVYKKNSVSYHRQGFALHNDSISETEFFPETVEREYKYNGDTIIVMNNDMSFYLNILLDSNKETKRIQAFKYDSTFLGESIYHKDEGRIIIKKYDEMRELASIETLELRPNGQLRCKTISSASGNYVKKECYSEKGLILKNSSFAHLFICFYVSDMQ